MILFLVIFTTTILLGLILIAIVSYWDEIQNAVLFIAICLLLSLGIYFVSKMLGL